MAFAFGDEEVGLWTPSGLGLNGDFARAYLPERIALHLKEKGVVVAHNATFELAIWNNIMVPRYGWPELKPEQAFCTMAQAYAMGLPGSLEDAALAMGLRILKDTEGRSLMLRMARPRKVNPDGSVAWWDDQQKLTRLYAYCQQDVRVERELHKRLMPLSEKERRIWLLDYQISQRGIAVDRPSVEAAIRLTETLKARYDIEMQEATGGAASSCNALIPIKQWLTERNVPAESLAKQDVADLLAGITSSNVTPEVRRVLTLRQEAAKASAAKLTPMVKVAGPDNRLRNLVQYHGAATGRWAGRKVQPHNLPRNVPEAEVAESILSLVREGAHEAIDMIYGAPMTAVSRCMRAFFVAPPGKILNGGDWSAIEGRGTAWIAGEEWKLKAFRAADAGTGPGIYELTAGKILGITPQQVNKDQRQAYGKVPELALGYQGGVGAFQTMAKTYGVKIADLEADKIKVRWRAEHPRIKAMWYSLQGAALAAVRHPGGTYTAGDLHYSSGKKAEPAGHPDRPVKFKKVGSFLWCLLPSGRALCYPYPKILPGEYGDQLTYMAVPSQADRKKGGVIDDAQNSGSFARVSTYGGSLMENVVQAICRDILAEALLRLDDAGFSIVLHVHDEIVSEEEKDRAEEMTRLMSVVPAWAKDFPIAVACESMRRYGT